MKQRFECIQNCVLIFKKIFSKYCKLLNFYLTLYGEFYFNLKTKFSIEMDHKCRLYGNFKGVSKEGSKDHCTILNLPDNSGSVVISGSSSENHSILLYSNGSSASLGLNDKCQLGIGTTKNSTEFLPVRTDIKFKSVACGEDFTLWISEDNQLYVCGLQKNTIPTIFNNLKAIQCSSYKKTAAIITENKTVILWSDFHDDSTQKEYNLPFPAQDISCGNDFVSVLLENQILVRVFSNGTIEPLLIESTTAKIPDRFVRMSSSENYTVAIDFGKNVWLFGNVGRYGSKPDSLPIYTNAINVFALPKSIVVIHSNFAAFSLGENQFGQFANGETKPSYMFTQAKLSFPVMTVVGNEKMQLYIPRPLTRSFTEFEQSQFIPGFHKYLPNS
ncbi:hypothetical protein TRFO_13898 [Tritrichomonas foetus]|uniref:Uncharacterized protein n=1 Tax=Tritrichomonas foetus TaxID=1144522 RepID=A0A1J4KXW1_9EUKA|nr:hypothetical protein TRFO_13898 [Tritrichomonas foetus]|eukprot:OHT15728.1 hypothetical protein TRFO_13898 [Tritrichomonas foetus]